VLAAEQLLLLLDCILVVVSIPRCLIVVVGIVIVVVIIIVIVINIIFLIVLSIVKVSIQLIVQEIGAFGVVVDGKVVNGVSTVIIMGIIEVQ